MVQVAIEQADLELKELNTELRLSTASKTNTGQFDNRGYNTEVIYSGSDQDYSFRDDRIRQAGVGEACSGRESDFSNGENKMYRWNIFTDFFLQIAPLNLKLYSRCIGMVHYS